LYLISPKYIYERTYSIKSSRVVAENGSQLSSWLEKLPLRLGYVEIFYMPSDSVLAQILCSINYQFVGGKVDSKSFVKSMKEWKNKILNFLISGKWPHDGPYM